MKEAAGRKDVFRLCLNNVELVSPYAMLEADGFYRNEVTFFYIPHMKTDFPASVSIGAAVLFGLRAEKVQLLDLRNVPGTVVDWFLVGTCESSAQMQAILGELQKAYKVAGGEPASIEYKEQSRWAVLDAGDIMAHLFEESRREEISLDALWSKAEKTDLNAGDFIIHAGSPDSTLRAHV